MKGLLSKRRVLFEFCDQPWFRGELRSAFHDCLSFTKRVFGLYKDAPRVIEDWSRRSGGGPILELCSGNGQNASYLITRAASRGLALPQLVVSDLFPQPGDYQRLKEIHGEQRFDYIEHSLSALDPLPEAYHSVLICTALHHFNDTEVESLIRDVIASGKNLCVIEPFKRSYSHLFLYLMSLPFNILIMMWACFFSKRISFARVVFTLIFPIVPLVVAFDGLVSLLRMYRDEELLEKVPKEFRDKCKVSFGSMETNAFGRSPYFWIIAQSES